jgi:hypothetical protein
VLAGVTDPVSAACAIFVQLAAYLLLQGAMPEELRAGVERVIELRRAELGGAAAPD